MHLYYPGVVEEFKTDSQIRRLTPKTLFLKHVKQNMPLCSQHSDCKVYSVWKQRHPQEHQKIKEGCSAAAPRSVYLPINTTLNDGGNEVTINGTIKSLDPLCSGRAQTVGRHPLVCDNCYSQLRELNDCIRKRKHAKLPLSGTRMGAPGFRKGYATKQEKEDELRKSQVENKLLQSTSQVLKKAVSLKTDWKVRLWEACKNDDQAKLITDLMQLFQEDVDEKNQVQIKIIENIVGKLKRHNNHHYVGIIKDVAAMHRNRLGRTNYGLLANIFCLPSTTTAETHCSRAGISQGES